MIIISAHNNQDIGISTYLMLLWKYTYKGSMVQKEVEPGHNYDSEDRPWLTWPRPPSGFIDIGYCISYFSTNLDS
jgi:tRNASer (uridine44-2'-O)-methyltransferase